MTTTAWPTDGHEVTRRWRFGDIAGWRSLMRPVAGRRLRLAGPRPPGAGPRPPVAGPRPPSESQPVLVEGVEVADLGLLVDGHRHARLVAPQRVQALLDHRQVEAVLVEDPGQEAELGRLGPVVVHTEPVDRRILRPSRRRVEGRQEDALHDRHLVLVLVRPEAVDDAVV